MPLPTIQTAYNNAISEIRVVESYRQKSMSLQPQFQGLVAEILMLRLFGILEKAVFDISCRIACKAPYINGIIPSPNVQARSLNDAVIQFKSYNRGTVLTNLHFSNVHETNNAIKEVISSSEPFRQNLNNYGNQFEEMRNVRNQIAHRNSSTYSKYKIVISNRYGAALKLKPSVFLTSTLREPRPVFDQYVITVKLMVSDLSKGY